ncbi:MAG: FAD:protein FMN transferase [Thermodesulfobacteriota bacterium]
MGSKFDYKFYCKKRRNCDNAILEAQKRLNEIDYIFSNYRDDSILSTVNSKAGTEPVKVPEEFIKLTNSSIEYSKMSNGAFDISVGYLFNLWKKSAKNDTLPSEDQISNALKCTGYEKIVIDDTKNTVYFKSDCLKLDYGAIGKGYAVDQVAGILKTYGIDYGLLNFGGNILALDSNDDNKTWEVGIQDPFDKENVLTKVNIHDLGIATSGDYEKYFKIKGKRYSHIIDPKTGYPVEKLSSVTVLANSGEEAGAFSTAFTVMGPESAIKFANNNDNVAVIVVEGDESDKKIFKSQNFRFLEVSD